MNTTPSMQLFSTLHFQPSIHRSQSGIERQVLRATLTPEQRREYLAHKDSYRAYMKARRLSFDGWDIIDWQLPAGTTPASVPAPSPSPAAPVKDSLTTAETRTPTQAPAKAKPRAKTPAAAAAPVDLGDAPNTLAVLVTAELRNALASLRRYLKKSNLPILSCVLLEQEGGALRLTTTNLDQTARFQFHAAGAPVSLALPHSELHQIVKQASLGTVLTIRKGTTSLLTYTSAGGVASTKELLHREPAEFPAIEPMHADAIRIPLPDALRDDIHRAAVFASEDNSRYVLNGICIRRDAKSGTVEVAACDGRRLYKSPAYILALPQDEILLPNGALHPTPALQDEALTLEISPTRHDYHNYVVLEAGNFRLQTKLIEGNFHNYKQVIPQEGFQHSLAFTKSEARETLLAVIRGLKPGKRGDFITLTMDPTTGLSLTVEGNDGKPQTVSGFDGLDIRLHNGSTYSVAFNRHYLMDFLAGDITRFEFVDEITAALIHYRHGARGVLMPARKA